MKWLLKHFVLYSNLFNKLENVASKSHFHFAVQEKRLKKQFFGAKYRPENKAFSFLLLGKFFKGNRKCHTLHGSLISKFTGNVDFSWSPEDVAD